MRCSPRKKLPQIQELGELEQLAGTRAAAGSDSLTMGLLLFAVYLREPVLRSFARPGSWNSVRGKDAWVSRGDCVQAERLLMSRHVPSGRAGVPLCMPWKAKGVNYSSKLYLLEFLETGFPFSPSGFFDIAVITQSPCLPPKIPEKYVIVTSFGM